MKRRKPRLSFDARDYDISSLSNTEEDVAIYKFKKLDEKQDKEEEKEHCKTDQDHPFIYQSI